MEQSGGISIISPPSITDNNAANNKVKSNGSSNGGGGGLAASTASRLMNAKEKLRVPWCKNDDGSAVEWLKKGVAEMIGTAIIVFLGCLGCVGSLGTAPTHLQICLSFGFAVMIAIVCTAHISGAHLNPAVTVGTIVCGYTSLASAAVYIISQMAGGVLGYALLKIITPQNHLHGGDPNTAAGFCATLLHPRVSILQGFFSEVIATGILVFMVCSISDSRNSRNTDSVAIKVGLAVAVLCFGFVPYTGCSMNPARSFGPALINNLWTDHWLFWFGPMVGALLSSLLYKSLFMPNLKEQRTITPENGV
uniref:Aquaporin n=1 Tax=Trichogramma kaykai TaxID=54128 RepID=A0ABD2WBY8_9HYME